VSNSVRVVPLDSGGEVRIDLSSVDLSKISPPDRRFIVRLLEACDSYEDLSRKPE
jgi:hypothetical protein